MLVVQQNCGKKYEYSISAIKIAFNLGLSMVYIQKLFIRNWVILHSGFNLYWLINIKNPKKNWVFITFYKNMANNVIFNN